MELVKLQLNISTTATLGREESGRCREVETRVNVWTVCQKKGPLCREVTDVKRWPSWRGGCCRGVAVKKV